LYIEMAFAVSSSVSAFAGRAVAAKATVRRTTRATSAKAAMGPYPEPGMAPVDDPDFVFATENAWWGNWKEMEKEEKTKWVERELIHGRWAMMGCAGAWGAEYSTGIPWFQAGKVCTPADCTAVNSIFPGQVFSLAPEGSGLPSFWNVLILTTIAMGCAEGYRTGLLERVFPELTVGDLHPGGVHFDPLNFAGRYDLDNLKRAEIKHARLAMFSWAGYYSQALTTNAYDPLPSYTEGAKGPYQNIVDHLADPYHVQVWASMKEVGMLP